MAENEHTGLPSGLPLIATLIIVSGAVWVTHQPLESSRPNLPANLESAPPTSNTQTIEAKLWQDPFHAALGHMREFHSRSDKTAGDRVRQCSGKHTLQEIGKCIDNAVEPPHNETGADSGRRCPAVHVLMAMMNDMVSPEDHESRLRARYALMTALRASGMTPRDPEHIDCFCVGDSPSTTIPYEWFEREQLYLDSSQDSRPNHVLILWLPVNAMGKAPMQWIINLLHRLDCVCDCKLTSCVWQENGAVRLDLLGPPSSTTLRAMIEDVQKNRATLPSDSSPDKDSRWLRIYSPWSTASPVLLAQGCECDATQPDGSRPAGQDAVYSLFDAIPSVFTRAHITFVRMIGTDDILAMHIIGELEQRGIRVVPDRKGRSDEIVLISEWDRFYGKAFPLTFAAMMECMRSDRQDLGHRSGRPDARAPDWAYHLRCLSESASSTAVGRLSPATNWFPPNLHTYTYISGIDGWLPNSDQPRKEGSEDEPHSPSRWAYHRNLELPIGCSQLDYARRLAQKLYNEYCVAKRRQLKAIGVVGTDVYDKLILLHALREQFRDTVLFTTDLDARLLHQEQARWTRNLLVVSNFGLELNPVYHYDANRGNRGESPFPPFRDGYQTAAFLACRAALGLCQDNEPGRTPLCRMSSHNLANLLMHPRVFEIGRGRAVDLTASNGRRPGLHPARHQYESPWDFFRKRWQVFALSTLALVLLVPLSAPLLLALAEFAPCDETAKADDPPSVWHRPACRVAARTLIVGLPIVFVMLIIVDHYRNSGGEPFSVTAGTSLWPGLTLWLVAILVGLYFLGLSFRVIRKSNEHITREFGLHTASEPTSPESWGARLEKGVTQTWRHIWAMVSGARAPESRQVGEDTDPRDGVNAQKHWDRYTSVGSPRRRLQRSILSVVLFLAVIAILDYLLGSPSIPYRGTLSHAVYTVFRTSLVILLLFLLFFAVDAIRLGLQLVHPLIARPTVWPAGALRYTREEQNASDADQSDWRDIRFISHLTESIERLLYLPSLLLLLVIAGRFSYFDNWSVPLPLVLTYVLLALYIVVCAIALVVTARRAKRQALENMRQKLIDAKFGPEKNDTRAERIRAMIADVQTMRRGAFRPLSENPVIHFLLIPSGGVGLLTLLAYVLPS